MAKIKVYETTKEVSENARELVNKIKFLKADIDNYMTFISETRIRLEKEAREQEERKRQEALELERKKKEEERLRIEAENLEKKRLVEEEHIKAEVDNATVEKSDKELKQKAATVKTSQQLSRDVEATSKDEKVSLDPKKKPDSRMQEKVKDGKDSHLRKDTDIKSDDQTSQSSIGKKESTLQQNVTQADNRTQREARPKRRIRDSNAQGSGKQIKERSRDEGKSQKGASAGRKGKDIVDRFLAQPSVYNEKEKVDSVKDIKTPGTL